MTDSNLTHVVAVLDRSGSMESIRTDTEGGFDAFVAAQAEQPGVCKVTLVQFDDVIDTVYSNVDVNELPKCVLRPRGSTALYDAVGMSITKKGEELEALPEDERPSSVIFVVLTDGYENASREWNSASLKEAITRQQDEFSWNFIFLGANQDAVLTAGNLGIGAGNALTYAASSVGTYSAFDAVSNNVSTYRSARAAGQSYVVAAAASAFTDDQRDAASDS